RYAFITNYHLLLAVVIAHGIAWSALLAASGAYMTATIPASRRAEGLSYWGLATVLAVGVAPAIGFWVYRHGWVALCVELAALNLVMAIIAWALPDDRLEYEAAREDAATPKLASLTVRGFLRHHIEWRVFWLAITTALISFGYGALTTFSALFADELGVEPRSLFLSTMAITIVAGRLLVGRALDAIGPRRVLVPCLAIPAVGLLIFAFAQGPTSLAIS